MDKVLKNKKVNSNEKPKIREVPVLSEREKRAFARIETSKSFKIDSIYSSFLNLDFNK